MRFNLLPFIFVTVLIAGCKDTSSDLKTPTNFSQPILDKALEKIRLEYVDKPDEAKMMEGALNGMLMALDPYCSFCSTDSFQLQTETQNGEFGGLGMDIIRVEEGLKVIAPTEDLPAHKAGIKPGDIITQVNNSDVTSRPFDDVLKQLHGKPGTPVNLIINRGSKAPFPIKIIRDQIVVNPVKYQIYGDIAYIRITAFNDQTTDKLLMAIKEIQKDLKKNLHGIVLDLRNNPGGNPEQAVSVANVFLNSGTIVQIKSRNAARNYIHKARGRDLLKGIPVSVLINKGSASASEIVAAALKDNRRAVLIGEKTFGKGLIQDFFPIENYGSIKLTISRFYTPKGQEIQNKGVEPDIPLSLTASESQALIDGSQHDKSIQRAIDLLRGLWAVRTLS